MYNEILNWSKNLKKYNQRDDISFKTNEFVDKNGKKTIEIIGKSSNMGEIKLSYSITNDNEPKQYYQAQSVNSNNQSLYNTVKEKLFIKFQLELNQTKLDDEIINLKRLTEMSCDDLIIQHPRMQNRVHINDENIVNQIKSYLINYSKSRILEYQNELIKYKKMLKNESVSSNNNFDCKQISKNNDCLLGSGTTQSLTTYQKNNTMLQLSNIVSVNVGTNYKQYTNVNDVLKRIKEVYNLIEQINDWNKVLNIYQKNDYIEILYNTNNRTYSYEPETRYSLDIIQALQQIFPSVISVYENELIYLTNTIEML